MADFNAALDGPRHSASYWTTVNASEALPGIVTPLNWSWYDRPSENAQTEVFKAFGVLRACMSVPYDDFDRRFSGVFFGRYVLNVDTWRHVSDLTPGSSGDAVERQFFGEVRPGIGAHRSMRRYGIVAMKLPLAILRSRRKLLRVREAIGPWWRDRVTELERANVTRAVEILFEAHQRFAEAQAIHIRCSIIAQMAYQNLAQLAQKVGLAGIENRLATGYGLEETAIQEELWCLACGSGGSLDAMLRHHGYTGPGELARPSWREDRRAVLDLIERFRSLPDEKRPRLVAERQRQQRKAAERELLGALPAMSRSAARLLLKMSHSYMPLRESGRAALLHGVDAGRAAANAIGRQLAVQGMLNQKDDIFFLNLDEIRQLTGTGLSDAKQRVAIRRKQREYYLSISLPQAWSGRPTPMPTQEVASESANEIKGISVTQNCVSGRARVVIDPTDADAFEAGEILVCPLTDPSWASLFVIAAGVVIDVGGPLSHGAVVAREMGIPCIINTQVGTRQIRTGDEIRIDGNKSVVEILKRGISTPATGTASLMTPATRCTSATANPESTAALQLIRLKGRMKLDGLTETLDFKRETVENLLADLVAAGDCSDVNGSFRITPAGRDHLAELITMERETIDHAAMHALYEAFHPFNVEFKKLVTAWQLRNGAPNDHADLEYDQHVLDGVSLLNQRFLPLLDQIVATAPRLAPYSRRFIQALTKVQAGDHSWLTRPIVDSYHTVWFELHEDLIGLAGLTRASEASAGRAA